MSGHPLELQGPEEPRLESMRRLAVLRPAQWRKALGRVPTREREPEAHGVAHDATTALAWLLRSLAAMAPISGTSPLVHLEEDVPTGDPNDRLHGC